MLWKQLGQMAEMVWKIEGERFHQIIAILSYFGNGSTMKKQKGMWISDYTFCFVFGFVHWMKEKEIRKGGS